MNDFRTVRQQGFTLLEIMISLVLICLVVVSIIELSSANLRNLATSDDRIETLNRVNAKLREILESNQYKDRSWQEVDSSGYTYDIEVTEILKERSSALAVMLQQITVSAQRARDKDGKKMTLKTARMVSKANALIEDDKSGVREGYVD